MKRTIPVLLLSFFLSSCAQIFDSNLFQGFDAPPPLDTSALKKASVEDIQDRMSDDSFYEQLKEDPKALDVVQTVLEKKFTGVSETSTDAEKTAAVSAASTYIVVTANSTTVAEIKSAIGNNLVDLKDALAPAEDPDTGVTPEADFSKAFDAIVGDKSEKEVASTLKDLVAMADALKAMQAAATDSSSGTATVDSEAFLSGTEDAAGFSQLVLMAAAADALTAEYADQPDPAAAAAEAIASGTIKEVTDGSPLDLFLKALQGDSTDPTANEYAYLNAVTGQLPIDL